MLLLLLVLALACGCYASESPLPRCSDQLCAKDPHCVYHRGRSVCWNVEDGADQGGTCRCCQNCIAGTNVFIDEECHSAIQGCQTSECPKVRCTYGSYIPLCDCCQSCISIATRQKRYREHLGSLEKRAEEDRRIKKLEIALEKRRLAMEERQIERRLATEERQVPPSCTNVSLNPKKK
ncbi:hypothetical protein HPB47_023417 [Ixodes persulcatus]|uniref:Uncharacterized protein n=1 Tax=Ixodes persulcatus TaxID=34615 RepID=A0AC60Q708_IXOPE|nr:hypothetical protein HPB47_023417 [Ixodes persulcatus]